MYIICVLFSFLSQQHLTHHNPPSITILTPTSFLSSTMLTTTLALLLAAATVAAGSYLASSLDTNIPVQGTYNLTLGSGCRGSTGTRQIWPAVALTPDVRLLDRSLVLPEVADILDDNEAFANRIKADDKHTLEDELETVRRIQERFNTSNPLSEWSRSNFNSKPSHWTTVLITLAVVAGLVILWKVGKTILRWKMGKPAAASAPPAYAAAPPAGNIAQMAAQALGAVAGAHYQHA